MNEIKRNCQMMVFPSGPICNLKCKYCYYIEKKNLYTIEEDFNMSEHLLEQFIKKYIEVQQGPEVFFIWQGGEPTLRGIDFFKEAVLLQKKFLPTGWKCHNSIQTNGTLLNDEWCEFFKKEKFLIGLSIDGPKEYHNRYRQYINGKGSHKMAEKAIELLKKYDIEFNVICTINHANVKHSQKVYQYFVRKGVKYIQFIPIVNKEQNTISAESISSNEYADFMIQIFEQWRKNDIGKIYIQLFEECLSVWLNGCSQLCIFSEVCGSVPVMEHNGDIYSCDHFVTPEYKLGNLLEKPLSEILFSQKQICFGNQKKQLSNSCQKCKYIRLCYGGCLRSRVISEYGKCKDYLCKGYQAFFEHISPYMEQMCIALRQNGI